MRWAEMRHSEDYNLYRSVAPTIEPVDPESVKLHTRIDHDAEDALLREYIQAARSMVETDAQIALATQTWVLTLDCFPSDVIELRRPPIQSVTSIAYLDTAGAAQTLATSVYTASLNSQPGRITLKYGQSWPSTYSQAGAVTVTFVAGYASVESVPAVAQQAIRMLVAEWYRQREAGSEKPTSVVPYGYNALIDRLAWSGYR